jgi:hypothetical protein
MINTINYYTSLPSTRNKDVYFRIHESGDFYNQEYYDKWIQIINSFPNIHFLAYTKSIKYVHESKYEIPSNLTIRFSVWNDTSEDQIKLANDMHLPIFTALKKEELDNKVATEKYAKCSCKCENCKKCFNHSYNKIAVAIH